jgi:hypothetical protein
LIGKTIALLCRIGGWYVPMYGAGRLESHNVKEYEDAADLAVACVHPEFVECLLEMAEVEWDHEAYFRGKVESHWLRHVIRVWAAIPPKSAIRTDFAHRNPGYVTPAREPLAVLSGGALPDLSVFRRTMPRLTPPLSQSISRGRDDRR